MVGTETSGSIESIAISQLIAAEGARVPAAADAQRDFTAALVLLHRPGEDVDPVMLAQLERFRVAFESYFQSITDGRANIAIGSFGQHTAAPIAPPSPLTGSLARAARSTSAVAWLKQQHRPMAAGRIVPARRCATRAGVRRDRAQVEPTGRDCRRRHVLYGRVLRNSDSAAWRCWAANPPRPPTWRC